MTMTLNPPGTRIPEHRVQVGFIGAAVTMAGVVLVLVSYLTTAWFRDVGWSLSFGDLNHSPTGLPSYAQAYVGWLGWLLLAASAAAAFAACAPTRNRLPALTVAVGLSAVAALATLGLLLDVSGISASGMTVTVQQAGPGPWLAIGGFLVIAVGAGSAEANIV